MQFRYFHSCRACDIEVCVCGYPLAVVDAGVEERGGDGDSDGLGAHSSAARLGGVRDQSKRPEQQCQQML